MSDVRLSDYITTTTNSVTLTLVNGGGSYNPEQHPDFIAAKNGEEGYEFYGYVCRECGAHSDDYGATRKVRFTDTGYDTGYANVTQDGEIEWDSDYIEADGDYHDVETIRFMCEQCNHEEDDLEDLIVAFPMNALEDESIDDCAFTKSLVAGRLIVFDAEEAKERYEEEQAERARRQLDMDRQALATLQARIAHNERKAA